MIGHRHRLAFIVAGNIVWCAGVLWLILLSHVPRTHPRSLLIVLLLLVPLAIYIAVLGMRSMPWIASSMKMLIAGLVLLTIASVLQRLLGFDYPGLGWLSAGGMIAILLSMLSALVGSLRHRVRTGGPGKSAC